MLAVVLGPQGLACHDNWPTPEPAAGEVRVKVLQAGICETDLQLVRGYMNFRGVLGHEFVGIATSGKFAGCRVVGEINCSCHVCETCLAGLPNHCPHRSVLGILNHDGAFAESVCVPERNLHPVPDVVTNDQAVFVEPLAAAFQIPAQLPDLAGRRVVLLGDGRLGQLCAQVIQQAGAELTVIGKHQPKLDALRRLGIETRLRSEAVPDHRADVAVDCTGSATGIEEALQWLRPRGTLVLKSTVAGRPELSLAPIVIDELQVIGSRCGPFPAAIDALAERKIEVDYLIEHRSPLTDAVAAFDLLQQRNVLKIVLQVAN